MDREAVITYDGSLNAVACTAGLRMSNLRRYAVNLCALLLALFPLTAHAAPAVGKIVNEAIKAVQKTSYSARLKFLSQIDNDSVREVRVSHLAPDLYHVEPLREGQPTGSYMVENASELVRISNGTVMQLPRRQFSLNDALTIKFLRDLGAMKPPTTVLSGRVGKYETWMLRQDMVINKPYIITVGIDKATWFPVFLLVIDGAGKARVYYEVEDINYKQPAELADSLFTVPESRGSMRLPRAPEGGHALMQAQAPQATPELPLFPQWLPSNYHVEALSLLRCHHGVPGQDCALVYQLEAYGPELDDLVSIFQMKAGDEGRKALSHLSSPQQSNYVLSEKNGWVIAVFGDLPHKQLRKIATQLSDSPDMVKPLLDQTSTRDGILDQLRDQ